MNICNSVKTHYIVTKGAVEVHLKNPNPMYFSIKTSK